jgi:flagellar basal body-associated protein FliL
MKMKFIFFSLLLLGFLTVIAEADAAEKRADAGGGYIELEPFTVNLADADTPRFLQVSLSMKGARPEVEETIKSFLPMIRHAVILALCQKRSDVLLSTKGKIELLEELKNAINQALPMQKERGLTEVVFTNFVIQ